MKEWKEYKLGELGEVVTGKTPSSKFPEEFGDEMPFVTPTDYKNYNKWVAFAERNLSSKGIAKLSNKVLPEKSLLVTCIGSDMGKVAINRVPVITNQQINSIIPNEKVDANFLYYKLIECYDLLKTYGEAGTAVPIVNKGDFEGIEIEIPKDKAEQTAIATVLSSLDEKIDLLHRQNKTLEGLAEVVFREWFVEGADDEETTTLDEFADNIRENIKVEDLNNYKHYVGLEHIPKKCITLTDWGNPETLESNKSVFREYDILFGKLRSYFHKVVFAPMEGVCSTDILVIRPKKKEWFAFCLFWFFNKDVVEFSDLGSGGTRMPRTNWEVLSSYPIPKPDIDRIAEFNSIVEPFFEKIKTNTQQIRTLTEVRDTLLPKVMSGEVRVEV